MSLFNSTVEIWVRSLGFSRKSDLSGNRASGNPEPPHLPAKKPRQVTTSALLSIAFTCWWFHVVYLPWGRRGAIFLFFFAFLFFVGAGSFLWFFSGGAFSLACLALMVFRWRLPFLLLFREGDLVVLVFLKVDEKAPYQTPSLSSWNWASEVHADDPRPSRDAPSSL